MMHERTLVAVVDDDESVRESLPDLLRLFGLEVQPFASAEDFLASDSLARTGCLVLDVAMPGMSGIDLQRELARRRCSIPIVFMTAHAGERARSQALQLGAVAWLFKPFSEGAILDAIHQAFEKG